MQEAPVREEPVQEEPVQVQEEPVREESMREAPVREEPAVTAVAQREAVLRAVRERRARETRLSVTWAEASSCRHLRDNFVTLGFCRTSNNSTSFATRSLLEPSLGKAGTIEREPATSHRPPGPPERARSWSVALTRIPTSAVRMNGTMLWRLTRMPFSGA